MMILRWWKMIDNKMKGIVKDISNKGILLLTPQIEQGEWWNPIGDRAKKQVTIESISNEVELTIVIKRKELSVI